jgi:hypothetical protein
VQLAGWDGACGELVGGVEEVCDGTQFGIILGTRRLEGAENTRLWGFWVFVGGFVGSVDC